MTGPVAFVAAVSSGAPLPAVYYLTSASSDPVEAGRSAEDMVLDVEGLRNRSGVPVLMNHRAERMVGIAALVYPSYGRLVARGGVFGDSEYGARLVEHYGEGVGYGCSVGVPMRDAATQFVGKGCTVRVNGRTLRGPLLVVRRWTLAEISLTGDPADPDTSFTLVANPDATPPAADEAARDALCTAYLLMR